MLYNIDVTNVTKSTTIIYWIMFCKISLKKKTLNSNRSIMALRGEKALLLYFKKLWD